MTLFLNTMLVTDMLVIIGIGLRLIALGFDRYNDMHDSFSALYCTLSIGYLIVFFVLIYYLINYAC
jgi:hypothetical protein